jgi:hypothetical protein
MCKIDDGLSWIGMDIVRFIADEEEEFAELKTKQMRR